MNESSLSQSEKEARSVSALGNLAATDVVTRQIQYGGAEYRQSLELRDEVLRRPLGRNIADDDLSSDVEAVHIAAWIEERLIGTLLLRSKGEGVLQMKQVAVNESLRGLNVGRQLVDYAEKVALAESCTEIMLHAREVAVIFYEKLGYACEGDLFEEMGIPHYVMRKRLVP